MWRKSGGLSLTLVGLLGLALVLAACGDPTAATAPATTAAGSPASPTGVQTAPPATGASEATATPVVLPTPPGGRPTIAPTTAPAATATLSTALLSPTVSRVQLSPTAQPSPTSAPVTPLTGYPGKLSIIGNDLYLYISRFDGKPPQLLLGKPGVKKVGPGKDDEVFLFPTWSRDGKKLAAMSLIVKGGVGDVSNVYVAAADGSEIYKVQDSENVTPIYLSWSPDGNFLTVLSGQDNAPGYDLRLADTSKGAAGAKAAGLRTLFQGSPLYTSWSPDSDGLLVHTSVSGTDTMAVLKAKDATFTPQNLKITGDFGEFRAPAWSSDGGRLAISTTPPNQTSETIVIQGKDGTTQGAIDMQGSSSVFNWSPTEAKLVHTSHTSNQQRSYDGLYLSDLAGADAPKNGKISATRIINDPVLAFFWSPDGKKLAYVGFNSDPAQPRLVWNVYDLATKKTTKLVEWLPTDNVIQILNFFDQYAQSDSIWSPDSKAIVFSGWLNDVVDASSQVIGDAWVYVMPTEGPNAGQAQRVGPGALAFWAK